MIEYRDYQKNIISDGVGIIKENRFLYLAMEVRTGKTLTSLGICDKLNVDKVLFITKKKAISSIQNDYNLGNTMLLNGINFTIYHDLFNSMKKCLFNKHAYQVCITDQNWNNLSHLKTKFIFNNYISTDINNTNTLDNNITELKLNLINYIKNLLGIEDDIDLDANLVSHGVDSIVAMDISNWCKNNMNININQIDVLQDITINEILSRLPNVVIKQDTDIKKNVFFYDSLVKYSPEENVLEDFSLIYYIFGFISIILSLLYLIWNFIFITYFNVLFLYYIYFANSICNFICISLYTLLFK